ncbi:MAG: NUDIX hydrolase [Stenotrophomonas sp.]|nr:MAG: NUDIX hydrolase [Stenotrophomonas sp.]
MNALQSQRWAPHVTVATVVSRAGQLLLVEEEKNGRRVLNQPAGHLERGESLLEAAVRETREETGWDVHLTGFIGSYQWTAADGTPFLRFAFSAEPLQHHPQQALDTGIVQALWMSPVALQADMARLRSPLVWHTISDWLAGQRYPLSIVRQVAP